jgi:peptidyl-prolyl cis-trans isomerase A (cyclophilin A)
MAMKRIVCFVLAGIIGIGAKTSAQTPAQSAAKPQSGAAAKPGTQAKSGSTVARSPYDRALLRPALLKDKAPGSYQVKFTTTRGEFVVTVTRAWGPLGADRFYNLVKHHFFDNASFFRVHPGFVVQFGISAYPPVSKAWTDANIKDEPVVQSNKRGYITFAKTSLPNTRSTQVFINLIDNSQGLDSQGFAAFGVVDGQGMNVVEMMYAGYGENGPDQGELAAKGKPYVDKSFPKIDSIKTATLVAPAGAPAAAKPAAAPAPTKP